MQSTEKMRSPAKKLPPLAPGDRLPRDEFERRFDVTPGLGKAELLDGVVYMPPPLSHVYHSGPHAQMLALLGMYQAATPHTLVGDSGSLRLDLENMPQPDAYLMTAENAGGQARIDAEGYVAGAPELVAEIAASSASYDLHVKMDVYRRHGVREYIVWRTYDAEIDFFALSGGRFERRGLDAGGVWRSAAFPGLCIATRQLLDGDLSGALGVLRQHIAGPEHSALIHRLRGA